MAGDDAGATPANPPNAKKPWWMPKMAVMFPKFVTINNPRLAILYMFLVTSIMGVAIALFFVGARYLIPKSARGEAYFVSGLGRPDVAAIQQRFQDDMAEPFCTTPSDYDYLRTAHDYTYTIDGCAPLCSKAVPRGQPCMNPSELKQQEPGMTFAPTFFTEEIVSDPLDPTAPCNLTRDASGLCTQRKHLFVPGVEKLRLQFAHRFQVARPTSSIWGDQPDLLGAATNADDKVTTVIMDWRGKIFKTFAPGELPELTVAELFEISKLEEFHDSMSRPYLDKPYIRAEENIRENGIPGKQDHGPMLRLTGLDATIAVDFNNYWACTVNGVRGPIVMEADGPLACVSVRASRNWVTRERASVVDARGTTITRRYHGIRINFQFQGTFSFFDSFAIFQGITQVLIWAQIPIFVLYFFVCSLLGHSSEIYSRVIHHEISMADAVCDLASRLISSSAAFIDMADQTGEEATISLDRFSSRFRQVLNNIDSLNLDAVAGLLKSVGGYMMGESRRNSKTDAECKGIDIAAYSHACTTNSPLTFGALVQIFNTDRQLGYLEKMFNDEIIDQVRESVAKAKEPEAKEPGRGTIAHRMTVARTGDNNQGSDRKTAAGPCIGSEKDAEEHSLLMISSRLVQRTAKKVARLRVEMDALKEDEGEETAALVKCDDAQQSTASRAMAGDPARYEGEWVGYDRHGHGVQKLPDGAVYDGQWRSDKAHGSGVHRIADGGSYEGEWAEDKEHGMGTQVMASGTKYRGAFKSGLKHGVGRLEELDGTVYEGQFQDNQFNGHGFYTWPDGNTYRGQWKDNQMSGKGKYKWSDGSTYVGDYVEDCKEGHGIFTWLDGRRYVGGYKANLKDGAGTFTWPDGRHYVGEWKEGQHHGSGMMMAADGTKQSGYWLRGRFAE